MVAIVGAGSLIRQRNHNVVCLLIVYSLLSLREKGSNGDEFATMSRSPFYANGW